MKPGHVKQLRKEVARIRCQLKLQTPSGGGGDADAANTGKLGLPVTSLVDASLTVLQCS